jgi:hypothetical protein
VFRVWKERVTVGGTGTQLPLPFPEAAEGWFLMEQVWHFRMTGDAMTTCYQPVDGAALPGIPQMDAVCRKCAEAVVKGARKGSSATLRKWRRSLKRKSRMPCVVCTRPSYKRFKYCVSCGPAHGHPMCLQCFALLPRGTQLHRDGRCEDCHKGRKKNERSGRISVRTVSGGLPSLGKRR